MRRELAGFALLTALWVGLALLARPAPGVTEARWLPAECHPVPSARGHASSLDVTWDSLQALGVPPGRLPFDARFDGPVERPTATATVAAARSDGDLYMAWPILMNRLVIVRAEPTADGDRLAELRTIHAERLLSMTAHRGGLVLWSEGDHGVRRALLSRGLDVVDYTPSSAASHVGPAARRVPVAFAHARVWVEQDAEGFRSLRLPRSPLHDRPASMIPMGHETTSCLSTVDEAVRLGPDLEPLGGVEAWRVRYGTIRLVALVAAAAIGLLCFVLLWVGERAQRRLEGAYHVGTVGRDDAGALTWYDDDFGPSTLRRVRRREGEGLGRAVLVGQVGVPEGYRGAAVSYADALFVGTEREWKAWLRETRRAWSWPVWAAAWLGTILSWGLLATVFF